MSKLHRCSRCMARTSYVENGLCTRCLTVRRVDYGPALTCLGRNLAIAGALTHEYARGRAAGIDDGKWIADQFARLPPGTDDTKVEP